MSTLMLAIDIRSYWCAATGLSGSDGQDTIIDRRQRFAGRARPAH